VLNALLNSSEKDFQTALGIPRSHADQLVEECEAEEKRARKSGKKRLPAVVRVYLYLVWVRHYPTDELLSIIFEMPSLSTTTNYRRDMSLWLYHKKRARIATTQMHGDPASKVTWFGSNVAGIVDAAEQLVASSCSSRITNWVYHSSRLKQNSVKLLLISNTRGKIAYISPSEPGSLRSDYDLAEEFRPEFSSLFQPDDIVLGDYEFEFYQEDGEDEDLDGYASVYYKKKPNRPSIVTIDATNPCFRAFSRSRIRIEKAITEIKKWRACSEPLRGACSSNLLELHHQTWTVVASFVNDFVDF